VGRVSAWPSACRIALDLPLNVGLAQIAHLETGVPELRLNSSFATNSDPPQIEGGTIESFRIHMKDPSSKPIEVAAPITVLLHSALPVLSENGSDWKTDLTALISQDHDSTPFIYFRGPRTSVSILTMLQSSAIGALRAMK
jgi:hypothetical protein